LSLVSVSEHEFRGDVPDVTANQDWNCAMLKGTFGNTGSNLAVLPTLIGEGLQPAQAAVRRRVLSWVGASRIA
jgi:hypothetical protein